MARFAPLIDGLPARRIRRILAGLVLAAAGQTAAALPPVVLDPGDASYPLTPYLEQLEDPGRQWTLADVAAEPVSGRFHEPPGGRPPSTDPDAGIWVRFRVSSEDPTAWLLRIDFSAIDRVCVYWPRPGGVSESCTGTARVFAGRPVKYHSFAFPLPADLSGGELVYLYAESSVPLQLPMVLVTRELHYRQVRDGQLSYGLYFGFLLALVLYNLLLFVGVRDTAYLFYSLHLGSLSLAFFGFEGLANEYLWPETPGLRSAPLFLLGSAFLFGALYVRQFLLTRAHAPRTDRLLLGIAGLGGLGMFATLFDGMLGARIGGVTAILFAAGVLGAAVLRLRAGYRPAWYLLAALAVFLVAVPVTALTGLRVIPWNGLNIDVSRLGAALGALLLSFGLAYRMRELAERERLIPQLEAHSAEIERFAYTVSHDLKSPLITIKGFLGLLERDASSGKTEAVEQDIRRIRAAADRMGRLLDELLELSRAGRLESAPEKIDLDELVRESLDLVAGRIAERGATVEVTPGLPTVFGDRSRLLEVFQNLIDNAVKYLGDQPAPRIEIGVRRDDEPVVFVRDNGIGIDPADQQKVFALFERLDAVEEGTGLGLALVKRIVELHGGRIWVESEGRGRGSTFCLTFGKPEES